MENPFIGVIVINWNNYKGTSECIAAIQKSKYKNIEIVVVDNASGDESDKLIKEQFPEVILIKNKENLGWGGGINPGIRYSLEKGAQYVWLINADLHVESDTLTKLVKTIESDPNIGMVSPVLYYQNASNQIQHCGSMIDWKRYDVRHLRRLEDIPTGVNSDFWIWATAALFRKEVFEKVGYFNENYFIYCDELEFSQRVHKIGFKSVMEPTARAFHEAHGYESGGYAQMPVHYFFYITRNRYFFWKANISRIRRVHLFFVYIGKTLEQIGFDREQGREDFAVARFSGLYCGLRNIGGKWDPKRTMPRIIQKILLFHPYFWSALFQFDFRNLFGGMIKKVRVGIGKNY